MIETLLACYLLGGALTLIIGGAAAASYIDVERKWGARIALAFPLWPLTVLAFIALGVIYLIDEAKG